MDNVGCLGFLFQLPTHSKVETSFSLSMKTGLGWNGDDDEDNWDKEDYPSDDDEDEGDEPDVMEMEDIADAMKDSGRNRGNGKSPKSVMAYPKEMLTPHHAVAHKKEVYRHIHTHSAVELCRWKKYWLRGRGGCHKHNFYTITSYQCMEDMP